MDVQLAVEKVPRAWSATCMGVGSRLCQRKSGDLKIVVGELIMLDVVIRLSTDLKSVFYKTWALPPLHREKKNGNLD